MARSFALTLLVLSVTPLLGFMIGTLIVSGGVGLSDGVWFVLTLVGVCALVGSTLVRSHRLR